MSVFLYLYEFQFKMEVHEAELISSHRHIKPAAKHEKLPLKKSENWLRDS